MSQPRRNELRYRLDVDLAKQLGITLTDVYKLWRAGYLAEATLSGGVIMVPVGAGRSGMPKHGWMRFLGL